MAVDFQTSNDRRSQSAKDPSTAAAVRETRRSLHASIRNDWDYPSQRNTNFHKHDTEIDREAQPQNVPLKEIFSIDNGRVQEWRQRDYASSDPSSDEAGNDPSPVLSPKTPTTAKSPTTLRSLPFLPSSPEKQQKQPRHRSSSLRERAKESIKSGLRLDTGSASETEESRERKETDLLVQRKKSQRRHRRRQRLNEEMTWNDGLAFWEQRRNAWCCAKSINEEEQPDQQLNGHNSPLRQVQNQHLTDGQALQNGHARDQRSISDSPADTRFFPTSESNGGNDTQQSISSTSSSHRPSTTLIPLAKPLLPPTDPGRITIKPSMYPSIYSKCIIQAQTPSFPVNLSDMVPALVEGWKQDGEWPPQPVAIGPAGFPVKRKKKR